jgi:hypothetical protein
MKENAHHPDFLIKRVLHYPLVHASECCQLLLKILTGAGLSILTGLCLVKFFPAYSLNTIILSAVGLGMAIWSIAHYVMFLKRSLVDKCQCNHHLKKENKPFIVFGLFCLGFVAYMLFCSWIGEVGILEKYGGSVTSANLIAALTFLAPALFLGWLVIAGKITAFEQEIKS